ncbi:MAG: DUF692 family protein [Rhodoferax sp.]|nr:DUF692 family protein [Rhodoferax sp.]
MFLTELARRTGCGLLVDVNNIYVNALNGQGNCGNEDPELHCRRWPDAIPAEAVGGKSIWLVIAMSMTNMATSGSTTTAVACWQAVWRLYRHALGAVWRDPNL